MPKLWVPDSACFPRGAQSRTPAAAPSIMLRVFQSSGSPLRRYYGQGDFHFITTSCYRRKPLLGTARARNMFLKALEQVRRRYNFDVIGFVVMPEHVHLLLGEPEKANPSVVMQSIFVK